MTQKNHFYVFVQEKWRQMLHKTCVWIFIAIENGNNPTVPQVVIYPCNRMIFSNKNKETHTTMTWINLKGIVLNKRSQTQLYFMIPFIWHPGKGKITRTGNISGWSVAFAEGRKEDESKDWLQKGPREFL